MYSELSYDQTTPPKRTPTEKRKKSHRMSKPLEFLRFQNAAFFFGPKHVETRNHWESNDPQDQTSNFSFFWFNNNTLKNDESIWIHISAGGNMDIPDIHVDWSGSFQLHPGFPPYVSPHLKWQLPQTSFVRLAVWKKTNPSSVCQKPKDLLGENLNFHTPPGVREQKIAHKIFFQNTIFGVWGG